VYFDAATGQARPPQTNSIAVFKAAPVLSNAIPWLGKEPATLNAGVLSRLGETGFEKFFSVPADQLQRNARQLPRLSVDEAYGFDVQKKLLCVDGL
jgi:hypothetical protein